jgi:hypothetical protein
MTLFAFCRFSFVRAAILGCSIAIGCAAWQQARAAEGPFADFPGKWEGNGKIHIGDKTERIRCKGKYDLQTTTTTYVLIEITCASDSYKFDLSGSFQAGSNDRITGRWNENTRNVGGSASGFAQGNRFQLHFESTAITGNMIMITRKNAQTVTIDTIGTQDKISASIELRRTSH